MQAAAEAELRDDESPIPWWERAPFSGAANFATALSRLAAPGPEPDKEAAAWNQAEETGLDELLSYEGVLRAGARTQASGGNSAHESAAPGAGREQAGGGQTAIATTAGEEPRSASVTLRLSRSECAQLKQRAAEAGLTVSAYIRSCTFEAEALRAQVKQALRELREQPRGEASSKFESELRAEACEKKPPAPVTPAALGEEATRRWWQVRPSAKGVSAQA